MRTGISTPHKTVLLASSNVERRGQLNARLRSLRWHVIEAYAGSAVLKELESGSADVLLIDDWLPDLEIGEFLEHLKVLYPKMDLLHFDGSPIAGSARGPHRSELLHTLRATEEESYHSSVHFVPAPVDGAGSRFSAPNVSQASTVQVSGGNPYGREGSSESMELLKLPTARLIGELIGSSAKMAELCKMILLVAPRTSAVLIEGETGTGKEIVARAIHRLSLRAHKPLLVLNCAAIPEALMEAELFGHTRGAFTGATDARTGRIEAAHGGTLFLDEIGELPLSVQAKILRFLDSGEIQKIGQNHNTRVDVRIIAATHQHLEKRAQEGTFRLDLYHRLAVFPLEVPPLRDRLDDIEELCRHFLAHIPKSSRSAVLSQDAVSKLYLHDWPGNVRELEHVLERAFILAADSLEIGPDEIRFRRSPRLERGRMDGSPT